MQVLVVTVVATARDPDVFLGKKLGRIDATHVTGVGTTRDPPLGERLEAFGGDFSLAEAVDGVGRSGSSSSQYPPLLELLHSLPLGCITHTGAINFSFRCTMCIFGSSFTNLWLTLVRRLLGTISFFTFSSFTAVPIICPRFSWVMYSCAASLSADGPLALGRGFCDVLGLFTDIVPSLWYCL